ncbi:MAG: alpha/beta hydrolase [Cyclobacteriaceae bacterium]
MGKQPDSNYILSGDGLKLNYVIRHEEDPQAVVCILHGHGEHKGRYEHVMKYLNGKSISCMAFDLRGHGLSEGKRGHISSMDQVLNDVEESLKFVRLNYLEIPIFLFGHSFGGCVTLNYVLKKPILELTGFIASSPWLALAFEPPTWKVKMGNALSGILPRLTLKSELDTGALSKDPQVQKAYEEDNLVHNKVSSRFFAETLNAGSYAIQHADNVQLNGLIYHGNSDQIIDFSATKQFVANAGSLVEFHELDGVFHEPHNDIEQNMVFELISDWILKSVK